MFLTTSNVALATIVCTYVFTFLALLSSAIHVFMCIKKSRLSWDDISTFIAFAMTLGLVCQTTWAVIDEGQGQHVSDVTRSQFELTAKSLLVNEALWAVINMFIRLSALGLIYTLFKIKRIVMIWTWAFISMSIMHGIAAILTGVLICHPIQASWDTRVQGTCGNQTTAYVALEVGGLVIDIAILVIPMISILGLRLNMRRKLGIILMFSAGSLVTIITSFRIAALHRVTSTDFSYDQGYLGLLSTLGALLGIISCCSTSLPSFIHYLSPGETRRQLPLNSPRSKRTTPQTDIQEARSLSNHCEEKECGEEQIVKEGDIV
ncbi:hypothetical protein F4813DRAFT_366676 [Daldinia decipiens]|uniref:uncharacterized protein n=1 Tax=Daldinia decipiens TaxID=326647 RepID=UPI0020C53979|nr:uncharacterized protein F4813DRAFT_366676 [Daldinia decipiens]KAI1655627.1 hypothetical protein F4813DRAFT_366676 [Daldinia decipiens]